MNGTKIRMTIGGGGTASAAHGTGAQLMAAIATEDPMADTTGPAEVIWNSGQYVTVRGQAGAAIIVTCIPYPYGPAPDSSPAPTFS